MTYDEWNEVLAKHFFNPEAAGQQVRLAVTRVLLDQLGTPHGADSDDFVAAIANRDSFGGDENFCARAMVALRQWRERREYVSPPKTPGYIGYLCFTVLAVGEGEFSEQAYYPRLRQLLGETPSSGGYPHFEKTLQLWADLRAWLSGELRGSRGFFAFSRRGQHAYVSVPRAQVLLSDLERRRLRGLFGVAGIDAEQRITRADLANRLKVYGAGLLSSGTLKLLGEENEFREYLLDDVENELDNYDPSDDSFSIDVSDEHNSNAHASKATAEYRSTIELALSIELQGSRVVTRFRSKLNQPIPADTSEQGFSFIRQGTALVYGCGGRFPGWSSCLESSTGKPVDAATFDWLSSFELQGVELPKLVLRQSSASIRSFISGFTSGLPGYIESPYLPFGVTGFVAVASKSQSAFEAWAKAVCDAANDPAAIQLYVVRIGFPSGWTLYELKSPVTDPRVYERFPGPREPRTCRILLRGGIPVPGTPHCYFRFGPPRIVFSGYAAECALTIHGRPLEPLGNREYALPQSVLTGKGEYVVLASSTEGVIAVRRIRFLDSSCGHRGGENILAKFGRDGRQVAEAAEEYFSGCLVVGPNSISPVNAPTPVTTVPPAMSKHDSAPVILTTPVTPSTTSQPNPEFVAFQRALDLGRDSWTDQGGNKLAIIRKRRLLVVLDLRNSALLEATLALASKRGYKLVGTPKESAETTSHMEH